MPQSFKAAHSTHSPVKSTPGKPGLSSLIMENLELTAVSEDKKLAELSKALWDLVNAYDFETEEGKAKYRAIRSTVFMSHFHTTGEMPR